MEQLLNKATGPPSAASASHQQKTVAQGNRVSDRGAAATSAAAPARHRRIQDSDDDDDDVPVSRSASATALSAPQPMLAQDLLPQDNDIDDDDIVLLTQGMRDGAVDSTAASSSTVLPRRPSDANSSGLNPVLHVTHSAAASRQRRIRDSDSDDDNQPVLSRVAPTGIITHQPVAAVAESSHAASGPMPAVHVPVAAAPVAESGAAAARPKLKGLGSLVRRCTYFPEQTLILLCTLLPDNCAVTSTLRCCSACATTTARSPTSRLSNNSMRVRRLLTLHR